MAYIEWDDEDETWFCGVCLVNLPHGDMDIHENCKG